MKLKGSCHCQSVQFTLNSEQPYPFNRCYCSICRKTAGGGGYAINLGGDFNSMKVDGKEFLSVYQARVECPERSEVFESPAQRHFCSRCGSALWLWDPRWPELVHPFASAIDTELPIPPERTHMMLQYARPWIEPDIHESDQSFDAYPEESLAEWHKCRHLNV
ncbi:GFA family protein [Microbulbifer sp. ANSA001]|uniref:GFA family protein n=1 Tax=Microbulbifer TaxID=48073 RepID=UPI000475E28B|nr:GFA family protein [Microbulbifer variabilis]